MQKTSLIALTLILASCAIEVPSNLLKQQLGSQDAATKTSSTPTPIPTPTPVPTPVPHIDGNWKVLLDFSYYNYGFFLGEVNGKWSGEITSTEGPGWSSAGGCYWVTDFTSINGDSIKWLVGNGSQTDPLAIECIGTLNSERNRITGVYKMYDSEEDFRNAKPYLTGNFSAIKN